MTYKIADNIFTITTENEIDVWKRLSPRFKPFQIERLEFPNLEISICQDAITECDAEPIYTPTIEDDGYISARVFHLEEGQILIELKDIDEPAPRVAINVESTSKIVIRINPVGGDDDTFFLTHSLMLAFMIATSNNGTLLLHASSITFSEKAYIFQGLSGTGKSTHARLWVKNIPGAELLNDDHPLVRFDAQGKAIVYGSPWSGKTACYRNESAPVGAFVRIVRGSENQLKPLSPLPAYASLSTSVFFLPFLTEEQREVRHAVIERLVSTIPCYEMHCRPDADAAFTCLRGLTFNSKN